MRHQGVHLFAGVRVHEHAGPLIDEQQIFVFVQHGQMRPELCQQRIGPPGRRGFEAIVAQIQLQRIARAQPVTGARAARVALHAAQAQIFLQRAGGNAAKARREIAV